MAFTPLNALNSFLAVARRRSFAAAARDLGISTPALSQSVRQLESRLGVTLLTRTSRSVSLTAAGRRLLDRAGPGVEQALDAMRNVAAEAGDVTGQVKLSVPSSAVPLVLTQLVPTFAARYPSLTLDIRVQNRFVDIVAEGLDAGIRLVEAIDRDMVHVRLSAPTRVVVAGAPAYLERKGTPQKPKDLLLHDCLCFRWTADGESEPWAWELGRGRKTWRVQVRGPVITNDRDLLCSLALSGTGLLYTLEPVIARHVAEGRLRVVLEPYASDVRGLFLYFPSRARMSPALRAFVDVARELAPRAGRRLDPA